MNECFFITNNTLKNKWWEIFFFEKSPTKNSLLTILQRNLKDTFLDVTIAEHWGVTILGEED